MRFEHGAAAFIISILVSSSRASPANVGQSLDWEPCPSALAPSNSTLRCSYIPVPLDWDFPEKGNITIGFAKLPARVQNKRTGNIFFQPGGPGHQGSLSISDMASGGIKVGTQILDHFDMIGVDLRGTGLSEPIKCDVELYNTRMSFYPSDPDSFEERVQHNSAVRQSCLDMSGNNLIDYMDSISIAKDYEAVRVALGNEPMNWLSVSYGTQLGSQYAGLFPDNIRSMVLDGVVSQSQAQVSQFLAGAASLDATFKRFAQWCDAQNATACPAVQDSRNRTVEEMWTDIMAQAEKEPLPCRSTSYLFPNITADEIRLRASQFLYTPSTLWHGLGEAIYNITTRVAFPDWAHHDNTSLDIKLKEALAGSQTPLLNGMSAAHGFQLACVGWPGNDRNPPHSISIPWRGNQPNILIVDAIYDPATPLTWGMQLREEIGKDRVVMVLRDGAGHPSYEQPDAAGGKTNTAIEQYIFNLTLPEDGAIFNS
ncbi:alpha/beta-hydrolase [Hypoxylon crocopeplum]|nr:alpha/beta-hydrolase [Hypoxylon crocopeplum]